MSEDYMAHHRRTRLAITQLLLPPVEMPSPIVTSLLTERSPTDLAVHELTHPFMFLQDAKYVREYLAHYARFGKEPDYDRGLTDAASEFFQRRWAADGKIVYRLPVPLAEEFADSELRIVGSDLVWPANTFYVSVPGLPVDDNLLLVGIGAVKVVPWPHTAEPVPEDMSIDDLIPGVPRDQQELRTENIMLRGSERTLRQYRICALRNDVHDRYIVMDLINTSTHVNSFNWIPFDSSFTRPDYLECMLRNVRAWQKALRVLVTTILYLQDKDSDLTPTNVGHERALREALKPSRRESGVFRVTDIGKNTMVHDYYRSDASTRQLHARFMVRAHVRRLPTGKATRVKAHWKGPPWADVIARVQNIKPEE